MLNAASLPAERRRWTRIRIPCIVEVKIAREQDSGRFDRVEVETVDISSGGLCFVSSEPFARDLEIGMTLTLPHQSSPVQITLRGVVVWMAQDEGGGYLVSVKFTSAQREQHKQLSHFLESINVVRLLKRMGEVGASDLHLNNGRPPAFRIDGALTPTDQAPLTPELLECMVCGIMTKEQRAQFAAQKELDFGYSLPGNLRWRVNVHMQRGNIEAAFRRINPAPQSMDELGLPEVVQKLARIDSGLVLVCGATGSGKSTTLAALIESINNECDGVVVTVEDPIEYLLAPKRCFIKQREVGSDTLSFNHALRHVLRQDPDVILIGEIRDEETMQTALRAAETGHLVFATLHTSNAAMTIHRVVDFFPSGQRDSILGLLSSVLQAVVCQKLVRRASGVGKVLATEVLLGTPAVRAMIRENKLEQLPNMLQTGKKYGMHTFEDSLQALARRGLITRQDAEVVTGETVAAGGG